MRTSLAVEQRLSLVAAVMKNFRHNFELAVVHKLSARVFLWKKKKKKNKKESCNFFLIIT